MNLNAIIPYILPVLFALVIVALLPLVAGYIVLVERKVMADMQVRLDRCASVHTDCCSRLPTR